MNAQTPHIDKPTLAHRSALPLGAMLLASTLGAAAQSTGDTVNRTLGTVTVTEQSTPEEIKDKATYRATTSTIGKGKQELKDIPQTVTVMTEMLLNDRNLDDFREVLKTTAGITFQAGETGEEDVRLRGFSLGQAGDIYVDGMRDAPLIERDTFNLDRIEVLKGSASMLFGKGSTGGVVNQVSKQPFLMDQSEVSATVGTGQESRVTGDFNIQTGEDSALRINGMIHNADNHGATVNKKGIAPTYRWGIGLRDEFSVGLYHLETDGKPLYNHPWLINTGSAITNAGGSIGTIVPVLDADNYYGLDSDYLKTQTTYGTFTHKHRFDQDSELKTTVRIGHYERDLLASAIRFTGATTAQTLNDSTSLTRSFKARRGESDITQVQSDYTTAFEAFGLKHQLIAGVDLHIEDAKRNNSATAGLASPGTTTVGAANSGGSVADTRTVLMNDFDASNLGLYVQDTLSLTEQVKLIGGLRLDHFKASYRDTTGNTFDISDDLLSPRVGLLFQPAKNVSYYASFGTSYNTSGDTYQFALGSFAAGSTNAKLANTPPEKSRNFEIGGKFDLFDDKATVGVALFRSEKYNERNTDSDSAAEQMLLSGKRHSTGMEFNVAGRLNPKWDIFYNHTWIPSARIDKSNVVLNAAGTGAQVEGDRPGLTPKHSASLWSTYRVLPDLRLGMGLNYRSEQNPEGARHLVAASFTTVDAMAEYLLTDQTTLKLNVTNLTDKLYADALYRGFYVPGASRSVQLTLKTLF